MTILRRVCAVAIVMVSFHAAAISAQSPVPAPDVPDVSGSYEVTGSNPDGSVYHGSASIEPHDGLWSLQWSFPPDGGSIGVGILTGDVLSVIFQTSGGDIGLAVFKVKRGTGTVFTLEGPWLAPPNGRGHEILRRVAVADLRVGR